MIQFRVDVGVTTIKRDSTFAKNWSLVIRCSLVSYLEQSFFCGEEHDYRIGFSNNCQQFLTTCIYFHTHVKNIYIYIYILREKERERERERERESESLSDSFL